MRLTRTMCEYAVFAFALMVNVPLQVYAQGRAVVSSTTAPMTLTATATATVSPKSINTVGQSLIGPTNPSTSTSPENNTANKPASDPNDPKNSKSNQKAPTPWSLPFGQSMIMLTIGVVFIFFVLSTCVYRAFAAYRQSYDKTHRKVDLELVIVRKLTATRRSIVRRMRGRQHVDRHVVGDDSTGAGGGGNIHEIKLPVTANEHMPALPLMLHDAGTPKMSQESSILPGPLTPQRESQQHQYTQQQFRPFSDLVSPISPSSTSTAPFMSMHVPTWHTSVCQVPSHTPVVTRPTTPPVPLKTKPQLHIDVFDNTDNRSELHSKQVSPIVYNPRGGKLVVGIDNDGVLVKPVERAWVRQVGSPVLNQQTIDSVKSRLEQVDSAHYQQQQKPHQLQPCYYYPQSNSGLIACSHESPTPISVSMHRRSRMTPHMDSILEEDDDIVVHEPIIASRVALYDVCVDVAASVPLPPSPTMSLSMQSDRFESIGFEATRVSSSRATTVLIEQDDDDWLKSE